MVEQGTDVVDEERVEHLRDFLFVGELKGSLERDPGGGMSVVGFSEVIKGRGGEYVPDTLQVHWSYLHYMLLLLTLQDSISAASSHACDVEELGAVDHMVIYAAH